MELSPIMAWVVAMLRQGAVLCDPLQGLVLRAPDGDHRMDRRVVQRLIERGLLTSDHCLTKQGQTEALPALPEGFQTPLARERLKRRAYEDRLAQNALIEHEKQQRAYQLHHAERMVLNCCEEVFAQRKSFDDLEHAVRAWQQIKGLSL